MASLKKTTANRTGKSRATSLSPKELTLIDAIVAQVAVNRPQDITAAWVQATDNIKRVAKVSGIDPEMRKALSSAVKSLKNVSAPKLNTILQLWHTAVNFKLSQRQAKKS
ncbi:MAG: hypothetical protein WCE73_18885 [Candidatus Angelobacter sp.]